MLQLGDSFYAGVFRSGSSVAHRLLTSHSKQGISNPGMEAKAEETLKPSEAGLREGTPTDIPTVERASEFCKLNLIPACSVLIVCVIQSVHLASHGERPYGIVSGKRRYYSDSGPVSRRPGIFGIVSSQEARTHPNA
jgi:hypothetical protein